MALSISFTNRFIFWLWIADNVIFSICISGVRCFLDMRVGMIMCRYDFDERAIELSFVMDNILAKMIDFCVFWIIY